MSCLQINFMAKIDPQNEASFNLIYEQMLVRQNENGVYQYKIDVDSLQYPIKELWMDITLNETLPLKKIIFEKISKANRSHTENWTQVACLDCGPDESYANGTKSLFFTLEDYQSNDIYQLNYDVQRQENGHEFQIAEGRFVHYYATDNVAAIPQHLIFVLDKSGSMSGTKMSQLKDAMIQILDDVKAASRDTISLVFFNQDTEVWPCDSSNPWME